MSRPLPDLEKRIEQILADTKPGLKPTLPPQEIMLISPLLQEATQSLTQLFQEWAEGCVPEKYDGTVYGSEWELGFNECRTQTLNNLKEKQ